MLTQHLLRHGERKEHRGYRNVRFRKNEVGTMGLYDLTVIFTES